MKSALASLRSCPRARLAGLKLVAVAALTFAVSEASLAARVDLVVNRHLHELTASQLEGLVATISELGATTVVLWLTALAAGVLAALRHWRGAAALVLSVAATQAVVAVMKMLVARPRPDEHLAGVNPDGFSFPSAHAATAVALYAMLAVIVGTARSGRVRLAAYLAAGMAIALVGLSRVYLGAHYPTDVLAGWLTGGVLVIASWAACSRLPARGAAPA